MMNIEIYTKPLCGCCIRAKLLLDQKDLPYTEIDLAQDPDREREMIRRSGSRTVPQIFIDDQGVGGHSDLLTLGARGDLDRLVLASRVNERYGLNVDDENGAS